MKNIQKLLVKSIFLVLFVASGIMLNSNDAKAALTVNKSGSTYYVNVENASELEEAGKLVAYNGNDAFFGSHTLEVRIKDNITGVNQVVIWGWKQIIAYRDPYKITTKDYTAKDSKNAFLVEGTLTLGGNNKTLTIDGGGTAKQNKKALVYVSAGTCNIAKNAVLQNNANTVTGTAGAVYINEKASASLSSGTITNCLGPTGAVYVSNKSTFTINDGTISANTGADNGGAVKVLSGGTFNMNGGRLYRNNCFTEGGAVHNSGTFNMNGGTIDYNTSVKEGGGVRNKNKMTMSGGTIQNNSSSDEGGGIFSANTDMNKGECTLEITSGKILNNSAENSGGGIGSYYGATLRIGTSNGNTGSGPLISGNTAKFGGGIRCNGGGSEEGKNENADKAGGATYIVGGTITGNRTKGKGGGISVGKGTVGVESTFNCSNLEVSGNIATTDGGGIFVDDGTSIGVFAGNSIHDNGASENGAGVYIGQKCATANIRRNNFYANKAGGDGGGLFLGSPMIMDASNKFITCNRAKNGGHIAVGEGGLLSIDGHTNGEFDFMNGLADNKGGAIYLTGSSGGGVNLYHNVRIFKNTATSGGGVAIEGGKFTTYSDADSVHIFLNTASQYGGGVYVGTNGRFETGSESGKYSYQTYINENKAAKGGGLYEATTTYSQPTYVTLMNVLMYCNEATEEGGAIYTNGNIGIDSVTGNLNKAPSKGGFIYSAKNAVVWMARDTITNNQGYMGAGIYANSEFHLSSTSINQNGGCVSLSNQSGEQVIGTYDHSNRSTISGGGIYIDSSAKFQAENDGAQVFINDNTADYGGGISNNAKDNKSIFYCSFPCGNVATLNGGNIFNNGKLAIYNSEMNTGIASGSHGEAANGGCIYNVNGSVLELDGVKGYLNKTGSGKEFGGFLCNENGATVWTARCQFYQNQGKIGGAIYNNGEIHLGSTSINTNGGSVSGDKYIAEAYTANGGAVYNDGAGKLYVTDTSYIDHNATTQNGGGIYNAGYFEPNTLDAYLNQTGGLGGSLENTSSGTTNGTNANFRASGASYGAGVHNNGSLTLNGGEISTNSATSGAGVANGNAMNLISVNISNNTATSVGGGVLNENQNENNPCGIKDCTIRGNVANGEKFSYSGAGIYNTGYLVTDGSNFESNTGLKNGGGLYNIGTMELKETPVFNGNKANGNGSAVYNDGRINDFHIDATGNMTAESTLYNSDTGAIQAPTFTGNISITSNNGYGIHNAGIFSINSILYKKMDEELTIKNNEGSEIINDGYFSFNNMWVDIGTIEKENIRSVTNNGQFSLSDCVGTITSSADYTMYNSDTLKISGDGENFSNKLNITSEKNKGTVIYNGKNATADISDIVYVAPVYKNSTTYVEKGIDNQGTLSYACEINGNIMSKWRIYYGVYNNGKIVDNTDSSYCASGNISYCNTAVFNDNVIEKENGKLSDNTTGILNNKTINKVYGRIGSNDTGIRNNQGSTIDDLQSVVSDSSTNGIWNGGDIVINGASITKNGNSNVKGSAIHVTGTGYVAFKSGIMTENKSDEGSIYIENGGIVLMTLGHIYSNTSHLGGAVYICKGGSFTQLGGTIESNQADNGKAVYVDGGATDSVYERGRYYVGKTASTGTDDTYLCNNAYIDVREPLTGSNTFYVTTENSDNGRIIANVLYDTENAENVLYRSGTPEDERNGKTVEKRFVTTNTKHVTRPSNNLNNDGKLNVYTRNDKSDANINNESYKDKTDSLYSTNGSSDNVIYLSTQYNVTYHSNLTDVDVTDMPGTLAGTDDNGKYYVEHKYWYEDFSLSNNEPKALGYALVNNKSWNRKTDGTGTVYGFGSEYNDNNNLDVYAIWRVNNGVYVVYHLENKDDDKYTELRSKEDYVIPTNGKINLSNVLDKSFAVDGVTKYSKATYNKKDYKTTDTISVTVGETIDVYIDRYEYSVAFIPGDKVKEVSSDTLKATTKLSTDCTRKVKAYIKDGSVFGIKNESKTTVKATGVGNNKKYKYAWFDVTEENTINDKVIENSKVDYYYDKTIAADMSVTVDNKNYKYLYSYVPEYVNVIAKHYIPDGNKYTMDLSVSRGPFVVGDYTFKVGEFKDSRYENNIYELDYVMYNNKKYQTNDELNTVIEPTEKGTLTVEYYYKLKKIDVKFFITGDINKLLTTIDDGETETTTIDSNRNEKDSVKTIQIVNGNTLKFNAKTDDSKLKVGYKYTDKNYYYSTPVADNDTWFRMSNGNDTSITFDLAKDSPELTAINKYGYLPVWIYVDTEPISYTIRYNVNMPSGVTTSEGHMDDTILKYDETTTLTKNDYKITNYTFLGWSKTPDGSVDYTDEEQVKNLTTKDGDIINLYAVWEKNGNAPSIYVENRYYMVGDTITYDNLFEKVIVNDGKGNIIDNRTAGLEIIGVSQIVTDTTRSPIYPADDAYGTSDPVEIKDVLSTEYTRTYWVVVRAHNFNKNGGIKDYATAGFKVVVWKTHTTRKYVRAIDIFSLDTIPADSKWASGELGAQLIMSLRKDGYKDAKYVYRLSYVDIANIRKQYSENGYNWEKVKPWYKENLKPVIYPDYYMDMRNEY